MIIGVPKEIKPDEYRVAITADGVRTLTLAGHSVLVERSAGAGSGIADSEFEREGAKMVGSAEETWSADIVVKVKEPIEPEYKYLREGLILYTFLHLAANPKLAKKLAESGTTAIGYETVQDEKTGALPMLVPMSEVAGRMAVQAGAKYLEKEHGGRGVLLGGVPGVQVGKVAILGAGIVGTNAAKIAVGLGARTLILDTNLSRLRYLDDVFKGRIETIYSNSHNIRLAISEADLLIGAVLVAGAKAPWLVTRDMLGEMKTGSVIVDVSVDQGGCVETSRPTSHSNPTFVVDSVTHYCVANMPGAVPRTSTLALTNVTFPALFKLAENGLEKTMQKSFSLRMGLNVACGHITHRQVAESLDMPYKFPTKWRG
ncbi:Alanine dehydrogenase [hydrothermal vent metagenome]|uniref:alanine dehydrogenase n=1 Tax=hydrothermal vent metagenome TaxID=652676 RepID=A0A3B1BY60_9ZZZZ